MAFSRGELGENIIEVRPKAGTHIWSNRFADQPNQGLGELMMQRFDAPRDFTKWVRSGSAYFLFMGGKGCARVGLAGELLGGNQ